MQIRNLKVGIIGRGLHGYQTANEMKKYFKVSFLNLPEKLPEIIDSFDDFVELLSLDLEEQDKNYNKSLRDIFILENSNLEHLKNVNLENILNSDLIICYASHDDISLHITENCNAKLVIITGKSGKGIKSQINEIAKRKNMVALMPEICCTVKNVKEFDWFFSLYGKPAFKVKIENNEISKVKVLRCAFCGATRFVAEKVVGKNIEEAPRLAGLYTQIYPCLATRGIGGGIHLAAEMHKLALEVAIKRAKSVYDNKAKN